jgi:hypothetical protein
MENLCFNIDSAIENINKIITVLSKLNLDGEISVNRRGNDKTSFLPANIGSSYKDDDKEANIVDDISNRILTSLDILLKTSRLASSLHQREKKTIEVITEMKSTIEKQSAFIKAYQDKSYNKSTVFTSTEDLIIDQPIPHHQVSPARMMELSRSFIDSSCNRMICGR